ncbi:MAG: hypothetical protein A3B96_02840 [Candidatus Spechtbacteria bacterium RIFCSPHIGHO2_02_FULL_43_15b]|nr:MAG: hypothetical protein A3B96_02840 [Candidatus Spechtbacteria bacterium RIFCSPHIGHO2_02_FULL_43_15b]
MQEVRLENQNCDKIPLFGSGASPWISNRNPGVDYRLERGASHKTGGDTPSTKISSSHIPWELQSNPGL